MPAALALAILLGQFPFGEPPQEVLRSEPEAAWAGGAWRMLGPLPRGEERGDASVLSRAALLAMRAGEPWPVLEEPFAVREGVPLLWRDVDLAAIADAAADEFVHPRARRGLETGRVELARIPVLHDAEQPRAALFHRSILAREEAIVQGELRGRGATRLWLNGALAAELPAGAPPPARCELRLARGLNHLVIETAAPAGAEWWFELRHQQPLTQPSIDRAIASGVRFLLSRQQPDGAWPTYSGYRSGTTALALLALLKSELPRQHVAAQRALAALRRDPPDQTYSLALALLAVHAFADPAHDAWIEEMAGDLVEWQHANGLWGYPAGDGDLSNTQFAALALNAAAMRGIEIPRDTWRELAQATLACRPALAGGAATRARATGFGYALNGSAYASMTAAGVGTLQICADRLGEDVGRRALAGRDGGLAWLAENCPLHFALEDGNSWTTYMLYGLERAGALTKHEHFGPHPWYPEGAAWLLERQRGNGAWTQGSGSDVDTAFALLFLTRATAKAAITQPDGGSGAGRLFVSSPADGPLILRAALGARLELWVDAQSQDFRRFARVIYWLRAPGGNWEPIPGGPSKRFDAWASLDRPGVWHARASAFLHDGSSLGSGTLEIAHETIAPGAPAAADLEFDPAANLLRGGHCRAEASSSVPGTGAYQTCDLSLETRWLCAPGDAAPWLELRPERRVRGRHVVLRPPAWQPQDSEQQPLPARVRVVVNGTDARVLELQHAPPVRWALDLGAITEVRTLRIEILAAHRGSLGACSVGFGEIEVHEAAIGQE